MNRTQRHKIRQQRQRRRAGAVRRIEFVLSAESERDHNIHDFLASLPHGAAGEFIRQAIHEKMQREEQRRPEPQTASEELDDFYGELAHSQHSASAQFAAIMQELAELRAVVQQNEREAVPVSGEGGGITDRRRRVQATSRALPEPSTPTDPTTGVTQSTGIELGGPPPAPTTAGGIDIDMSGPPPASRSGNQPPTLPEENQVIDEQEFIRRFLGSVTSYRTK